MQRLVPAALSPRALVMAPLGAQAADLVVWWEEGFNPEEDAAVREIIAAFEQETGKQVELEQPSQNDIEAKVVAAVAAGQPPDFLFGYEYGLLLRPMGRGGPPRRPLGGDRAVRKPVRPDALRYATLLDATTGRRALYALPMAFATNTCPRLAQSPRAGRLYPGRRSQGVGGFWSFWCDRVQPAVRQATGRDDIWGVGLSMSAEAGGHR